MTYAKLNFMLGIILSISVLDGKKIMEGNSDFEKKTIFIHQTAQPIGPPSLPPFLVSAFALLATEMQQFAYSFWWRTRIPMRTTSAKQMSWHRAVRSTEALTTNGAEFNFALVSMLQLAWGITFPAILILAAKAAIMTGTVLEIRGSQARAWEPWVIAMDFQALAWEAQVIAMARSEFEAWKILTFGSITAKLELLEFTLHGSPEKV